MSSSKQGSAELDYYEDVEETVSFVIVLIFLQNLFNVFH